MINLKNKKILITGATGGIGNSLVKKFDSLDSSIVATGTNEEKLNNLKKSFNKIQIEQFRLDEHQKIEEFIDKVDIVTFEFENIPVDILKKINKSTENKKDNLVAIYGLAAKIPDKRLVDEIVEQYLDYTTNL